MPTQQKVGLHVIRTFLQHTRHVFRLLRMTCGMRVGTNKNRVLANLLYESTWRIPKQN